MTRLPLPPLPDLTALAHTTHPVLAAITPQLLNPHRPTVAHYDDSPYTKHDPEPAPDEDDGPWCNTPRSSP